MQLLYCVDRGAVLVFVPGIMEIENLVTKMRTNAEDQKYIFLILMFYFYLCLPVYIFNVKIYLWWFCKYSLKSILFLSLSVTKNSDTNYGEILYIIFL